MSNAIKFTETGSVTLQARQEGQVMRISVIDTGIGIPEKAIAHIFDRFEQATHDTDRHYGGTGLGLDISRRLIRMHGGELVAESTVGQGSIFSFTLPISTEPVTEERELSHSITSSAKTLRPVKNVVVQGILLIEDEASLRDVMHRTLQEVGYMVFDEHDGAQALEMASGLLPDLIILDVFLPNLNGWELLESLKNNPDTASIPVLICTANDDEGRATALGAAGYLRKPFSPDELLANVFALAPLSPETHEGD
jgi:CheY-like chemotaxis protein